MTTRRENMRGRNLSVGHPDYFEPPPLRASPKCSICRQPGHDKRRCPDAAAAATAATAAVPIPQTVFDSESCPVCMDTISKTNCCTTPCGHQFCLGCFMKAYQTQPRCPICRDELDIYRDLLVPRERGPLHDINAQILDARIQLMEMERQDMRAQRFNITLQNLGDQTFDVIYYRLADSSRNITPVSVRLHRNITPGTIRTINVGSNGDRFYLDYERTDTLPTMDDHLRTRMIHRFIAHPNHTYICMGDRIDMIED